MALDLPIGGRSTDLSGADAVGSSGADAVMVSLSVCAGDVLGFNAGARDGPAIFRSTAVSGSGTGARASAASMICCNALASAALVRVAAGNRGALASVCGCTRCSSAWAGMGALGRAASAFALASRESTGAGTCLCHCAAPYTAVAISTQAAPESIQSRFRERGLPACCSARGGSGCGLRGFTCAAGFTCSAGFTCAAGVARRAFRTSTKSEL
jgi:hypothetical protein